MMSEGQSTKALKNLTLFIIYLGILGLLACLVIYVMAVAPAR
jgi:hypothetical protein